jgi:thiamine pyrophosphokinase
MKYLIMANGEYGELDWYRGRAQEYDCVIAADGGAGQALRLGFVPGRVIGDLDSLSRTDRERLESLGAVFDVYPPEKDDTDTQLALKLAGQEGADRITIWGGTGNRLDHTLSNLFSAAGFAGPGTTICFEHPRFTIYLVCRRLVVPGRVGDTVSLITLGSRAEGVSLDGFKYPLHEAVLDYRYPYTVSNVVAAPDPSVRVSSGIVAVIHYPAKTVSDG